MSKTPQYILDEINRAKREKATTLRLGYDRDLRTTPPEVFELEHVQVLDLSYTGIDEIPAGITRLKNLRELRLFGCPLREVPPIHGLAIDYALYRRFEKKIDKNQITGLRFRPQEMSELNKAGEFPRLTTLDLGSNLMALPDSVGQLSQLTTLDLRRNYLTTLPDSLGQLSQLTALDLSGNYLKTLPDSLTQLSQLTTLDLSDNKLTTLPDSLGQLSQLKMLDLSDNKLTTLPDSLGQLSQLKMLNLSGNNLKTLPDSLGQLSQLTTLDLRNNNLKTLPDSLGQLSQLKMLDLSDNKLTTLPDSLGQLSQLKMLDLSDNKLTTLPDSLGQLSQLTALDLSGNYLTTLPDSLTQLSQLTTLNLYDNELATLPDSLTQLSQLTALDLSGNYLTTLPDSIGQLSQLTRLLLDRNNLKTLPDSLTRLSRLTWLDLSGNYLTTLPDSIGQLSQLTRLDLHDNELTTLPDSLTRLSRLTWLDLHGNVLTTLPDSIGQLSQLTRLVLYGNYLTTLPDSLTQLSQLKMLDLSDNKLTTLPDSVTRLSRLTRLSLHNNTLSRLPADLFQLENIYRIDFKKTEPGNHPNEGEIILGGNPIEEPPQAILEKGIEAVRDYFAQKQAHGTAPLFEAKLLLVGEGGAGKTSLWKKLQDETYPVGLQEESTTGINVHSGWQFVCKAAPEGQFIANLWDFGGQEIQYLTHQFFLTARSLYVLVADDRKQDTRYEYWFEIIKTLGNGSPVLVLLNERKGQPVSSFDFEHYRREYGAHVPLEKCEVDLAEKNLHRFRHLRDKIERMLQELPHVGDELPATWPRIRRALEKKRAENHLSLAAYRAVCREHGLEDEKWQLQLSGYLHDLGVILHFQDNPPLFGTVFINPQWVVNAVYIILESDHVRKQQGRFTKKWMFDLWQEKGYTAEERNHLLNLMLKDGFDLCYPLDEAKTQFIAPQLLPRRRPAFDWREKADLYFRFQYAFMPHGIITRFIVQMHEWIAEDEKGEDLVWERGVVLVKEGVRALVVQRKTERRSERVIDLQLVGPELERKEFLAQLRGKIHEINHRLSRQIMAEERVPIPKHPDADVEYQTLLQLEQQGVERHFVEKVGWVSVSQLLNGVELESKREWQHGGHEIVFSPQNIFSPHIEVNPTIHAHSEATAHAEASSELNFSIELNGLQSGFNELKEDAAELGPEGEALREEVAALQKKLQKLDSTSEKRQVQAAGAMSKARRLLEELNDTGTQLGKTVDKIKGGVKIAQDLGRQYNKIAEWCGLPVVPQALLGRSKGDASSK